jgi:hypothetical protein
VRAFTPICLWSRLLLPHLAGHGSLLQQDTALGGFVFIKSTVEEIRKERGALLIARSGGRQLILGHGSQSRGETSRKKEGAMFQTEDEDHQQEMRRSTSDSLTAEQRPHLGRLLQQMEQIAWYLEEQMRQELPAVLAHCSSLPNTGQGGPFLQLAYALRQEVTQLALQSGIVGGEEPDWHSLHELFARLQADVPEVPSSQMKQQDVLHPQMEAWSGPHLQEMSELLVVSLSTLRFCAKILLQQIA